jgi:MFS family permease
MSSARARICTRLRRDGLWRSPDFLKIWAGQTVSLAGSLVTGFALPLTAILLLHADAAQVALLSATQVAPGLVLGLVAGVWADRVRRRPLLIAMDLGRALAVGAIPVAALLGQLHIELLYTAALATSALSVVFEVAYPAYLASLVRPEELVAANSTFEASGAVAEAASLGAAGTLVQALSAPLALLVDAASYLVSALSLALIRAREPLPQVAPNTDEADSASFWRQIGDGLRLTLGNPTARALAGSAGIFTLFGNVIGVVLLLYLVRELHLGAALIGALFGLGGISAFAGSLVAGWAVRRWGIGRAIIGGLAIYTGCAVVMPLAGGPAWLAAGLLALGQLSDGAHTVYAVGRASLLQTLVPTGTLGRLHATMHLVEGVATLAGVTLAGVLGQTIGLRPALLVAVAGLLLAPLWLARSPLWTLRMLPDHIDQARQDSELAVGG